MLGGTVCASGSAATEPSFKLAVSGNATIAFPDPDRGCDSVDERTLGARYTETLRDVRPVTVRQTKHLSAFDQRTHTGPAKTRKPVFSGDYPLAGNVEETFEESWYPPCPGDQPPTRQTCTGSATPPLVSKVNQLRLGQTGSGKTGKLSVWLVDPKASGGPTFPGLLGHCNQNSALNYDQTVGDVYVPETRFPVASLFGKKRSGSFVIAHQGSLYGDDSTATGTPSLSYSFRVDWRRSPR